MNDNLLEKSGVIAETKLDSSGKIDFSGYRAKVSKLSNYSATRDVVKRLLNNIITTGHTKKLKCICYNYDFYEKVEESTEPKNKAEDKK